MPRPHSQSRRLQGSQSSQKSDEINGAAGTTDNHATKKHVSQSRTKPVQPIETTTANVLVMLARGAKILPQILVELWVRLMVCLQLLAFDDESGGDEFKLRKAMSPYNAEPREEDDWKVQKYCKLSRIYRSLRLYEQEGNCNDYDDKQKEDIKKKLDAIHSAILQPRESQSDFYKHYLGVYKMSVSVSYMDLHKRLESILPTVFDLRIGILDDILLGTTMTLGNCFKRVFNVYLKQVKSHEKRELQLNLEYRVDRIRLSVNKSKHHKELGDDPKEDTKKYLQTFTDLAEYIARDSETNPLGKYKDYLQPVEKAQACIDTYFKGDELIRSSSASQQKIEQLENGVDESSNQIKVLQMRYNNLAQERAKRYVEIARLDKMMSTTKTKMAELLKG